MTGNFSYKKGVGHKGHAVGNVPTSRFTIWNGSLLCSEAMFFFLHGGSDPGAVHFGSSLNRNFPNYRCIIHKRQLSITDVRTYISDLFVLVCLKYKSGGKLNFFSTQRKRLTLSVKKSVQSDLIVSE